MVNQRSWQTRIQLLLDNLTIVEVPPDATFKGEFEDLLHAFAAERAKGEEREDILQGVAVWAETRVYFQIKVTGSTSRKNVLESKGERYSCLVTATKLF